MSPYLSTALRYRWVIVLVLAVTWGAGGAVAYEEYVTSYEADATIWTDRQSQQFASLSPQDPSVSSFVTPAAEQAGVLGQLLQTRSFLLDVLGRAAIRQPQNADERAFLQDVSKRFRVDVLGTNLFRLSYRAGDSRTGSQMVMAALAERAERLTDARAAAIAAATTFYSSELGIAQSRVADAQRELDAFDATHKLPLSVADDYQQRQLRLSVDELKARVEDLKTRIDGATVMPAILQVAETLDFQVIDTPLEEVKPSGGTRPAALAGGSAAVAGLALVGLLIVVGTLLAGGALAQPAEGSISAAAYDTPSPSPSPVSRNIVGAGSLRTGAEPARSVSPPNFPAA